MQIHFLMAQQVMDFLHPVFVQAYPNYYYYLMQFLMIHTQYYRWMYR